MNITKTGKSVSLPFFSVVIPTYERPEDLEKCLESLSNENQSDAPNYELIVTDDSRSDLCRILVEKQFPQVSWGKGKQNGPAGNRNSGSKRAKGEWLIFLDDDCIAQKNYLQAYAEAIAQYPDVELFEGRIFADRPRITWAEGCPENSEGGMFWTSNLCVKKCTFERVGGFDERFEVAYEDVEFAYRIRKTDIPTLFVPKAGACHPWRSLRSGGKNWKRKGYQIESLFLLLAKHRDAWAEYGNPRLYFRNFLRLITKDLIYCFFCLKGRGLDILFSQALVSFQTTALLLFKKKTK
tara:strand:+ start:1369 stop:2253 length:885 start_codon:yes stop_codon:yes gene_type:complete